MGQVSMQVYWLNFTGAVHMLRAAVIVLLLALLPSPVRAEARIALLIGNQGYSDKVGALKNPHNDVSLIEVALKRLGFKVAVLKDAGYRDMDRTIKEHIATVRRAGRGAISFFYYSGHGVANPDTEINYLIPIDVKDANDPRLWSLSFEQNDIIEKLNRQAPQATHYVVFDACRNELRLSGEGQKALGAEKGFVPVAQTSGLLVAYATAPKQTASDIGEGGGPYAKTLAGEIVRPDVEAVTMFRNVQLKVKQSIGQDPWLSFPSLPEVYLAGRTTATTPVPAPAPSTSGAAGREWQDVKDTTSIAVLENYLRVHKDEPVYAALAQDRIEALKRAQQAKAELDAQAKSKAEADVTAKADAERQRVALLQKQEEDRKRAEAILAPGKTFRDCPTCPEMVSVPAGRFTMGSPAGEEGRFDAEGPQHEVTIGKPFAVGRFAVTRGEYAVFVRETSHAVSDKCWTSEGDKWQARAGRSFRNPGFTQDDQHPVVCVNWDDAKAYAAWLSKKTGKTYRLLSEAEREYVARAGTSTPFWWGRTVSTTQANYDGNYTYGGGSKAENRKGTVPVHSFEPNAWGLYQVHGNVWEWTEDCWHDTYQGAPTDGTAWTSVDCSRRVVRGGSWVVIPRALRSANRGGGSTDDRAYGLGFRLARTLTP
jgi:formylglycine-generating enzyme required for sulfatase activity